MLLIDTEHKDGVKHSDHSEFMECVRERNQLARNQNNEPDSEDRRI